MTSIDTVSPLLLHLLRGLVFLSIAFAIALDWRRFTPARFARPASWRVVILLLGALTLLQFAPIPWRFEIPPPSLESAATQVPVSNASVPALPESALPVSAAPTPVPFVDIAPEPESKAKASLSPWQLGFLAWAIGAVLVMSRWLVGRCLLSSWDRKSRAVESRELQKLFARGVKDLGIRRQLRFRCSDTAPVPLTWGWLRPVVLVPSELETWPKESQRMVLLHELSHVAHGDARLWSGGEQQLCTRGCMGRKDRKHRALILRRQMKKAVPGQDCIESLVQMQRAHVRCDPSCCWVCVSRLSDHRL